LQKNRSVGDAHWTLARHYDYFRALHSPSFRVRFVIVVPASPGSVRFLNPVFLFRELSMVIAKNHIRSAVVARGRTTMYGQKGNGPIVVVKTLAKSFKSPIAIMSEGALTWDSVTSHRAVGKITFRRMGATEAQIQVDDVALQCRKHCSRSCSWSEKDWSADSWRVGLSCGADKDRFDCLKT
jgi:hypothetical protein